MRTGIFSTNEYDREFFDAANKGHRHELAYYTESLRQTTAAMASGFAAVCAFVNDLSDSPTLSAIAAGGTHLIALRSAGFNDVDLAAAEKLNLTVMRVPAYSPQAVAERAVALMLTLNRNIHHADNRMREGNFDLNGLVGFNIAGKAVGFLNVAYCGPAGPHGGGRRAGRARRERGQTFKSQETPR
jgi:D-lactate dehydrogenase